MVKTDSGGGDEFYRGVFQQFFIALGSGSGYVKCDANKAYMKIDTSTQPSSAASYSFRFDGTTGIEDIEDVDNVESGDIYDLQGRKVTKPVKGGIYIKNGVKVIM